MRSSNVYKELENITEKKNPGSHEPAVCLCRLGEGRVSSLYFTESSNPSLNAESCNCYCKDINKYPFAGDMFPGQKIPTISDSSSTDILTQRKLLQTSISLTMCSNSFSPAEKQAPFLRVLSKHKSQPGSNYHKYSDKLKLIEICQYNLVLKKM